MFIVKLICKYCFCYQYCRGTDDLVAPHGIPLDLLDRVMIIRTIPYSQDDMQQVMNVFVKSEIVPFFNVCFLCCVTWQWSCLNKVWLHFVLVNLCELEWIFEKKLCNSFHNLSCLEVKREYNQNCFIYCQRATSSMGTVNRNSSYSPVGPWVCLFVF